MRYYTEIAIVISFKFSYNIERKILLFLHYSVVIKKYNFNFPKRVNIKNTSHTQYTIDNNMQRYIIIQLLHNNYVRSAAKKS